MAAELGQRSSCAAKHVWIGSYLLGNVTIVSNDDDSIATIWKFAADSFVFRNLRRLVVGIPIAENADVRRVKEVHIASWFRDAPLSVIRQAVMPGL